MPLGSLNDDNLVPWYTAVLSEGEGTQAVYQVLHFVNDLLFFITPEMAAHSLIH